MEKKHFFAVIPARWESSRFPGKPLADVLGKPMIQRVWERTNQSGLFDKVWIATDDSRIEKAARSFGAEVVMTSSMHSTGTERCAEAIQRNISEVKSNDIIFNIQGDEPFIDTNALKTLVAVFENPDVQIATLVRRISDKGTIQNPDCVKVVCEFSGKAMYFSRLAIPFQRDKIENVSDYLLHIGIYAFQADILNQLVSLPEAPVEKSEKLEQLRWLFNGYQIQTAITDSETHAVDTPEDLLEIQNWALKTGQIV